MQPNAEKANILLVDDNPDKLLALESVLTDLGQNLITARSGKEALKQLLKQDFAVILLDVQMPEMDGYETAALIRRRPRSEKTPIIYITAIYQDQEHALKGYALGAVDYIFAPVVPQVLKAKVQVFVDLFLMKRVLERQSEQLERAIGELDARIKEINRLNEILSEANLSLAEVSRAKDDFLANMSHELRTPMNSIIGFSEVLEDELFGPLNDKQREYIGNILGSGKHLLGLINDILDLAKVESGKMELEWSRFPLTQTLRASLAMLKEKACRHGISLDLEVSPEADMDIEADERKLKQIVFNLLSNAVKFTPDGGRVMVEARLGPGSDSLSLGGEVVSAPFLEIAVTDTGIGIKPEDLPRLFKKFSQLETPDSKTREGTGLGLALTRRLVELHGGAVGVESTPGQGSRFFFTLPVRPPGGK